MSWGGDEAGYVLDSFTGRFLVDSTDEGYAVHPLIREAFYPRAFNQKSIKYHRTAGEFYSSALDNARQHEGKLVPEYLGEAVYHFLAAGDRMRVAGMAFYKSELRTVARSHYQARAYEQAKTEYSALADLDPSDADAQFHLALIYGRLRQWNVAEGHFERARKLSPGDHRFLQAFASVKMRGDLLIEAADLLKQAHKMAPRHGATLVTLGELMERQGYPDEALAYYDEAVECDGENAYAHLRLAWLLQKKNDPAGAFYEAKLAMSCNPTDKKAQQLVAELRKRLAEADAQTPEGSEKRGFEGQQSP